MGAWPSEKMGARDVKVMKTKMKIIDAILAGLLALAISATGSHAMPPDPNGCAQPGDPNYIPSLGPCKPVPTGPMGPKFTKDQMAEHDRVAEAINDPKLIEQWDDSLRNGRTDLKDDMDMRVAWAGPRMAPDGTITIVIGVNTNGRPIPEGVFPETLLGHPVKVFPNAPFAVVGTGFGKPLNVQQAGGTTPSR